MKKLLITALAMTLGVLGLNAATVTNVVTVTNTVVITTTNIPNLMPPLEKKDYNKIDLTVGASGTVINGQSTSGLDVSVSINPFKNLQNLWVGVAQGLYWQPSFAGSTDVDVDWNFPIYGNFYGQAGWAGGAVYDVENSDATYWRTGPELIAQYYVSDDAYLYVGYNYDICTKSANDGHRWSIGIGLEF